MNIIRTGCHRINVLGTLRNISGVECVCRGGNVDRFTVFFSCTFNTSVCARCYICPLGFAIEHIGTAEYVERRMSFNGYIRFVCNVLLLRDIRTLLVLI